MRPADKIETVTAPPQVAEESSLSIKDMPEEVLSGKLGEILQRRMKDFPIAYAWPSLVNAAGAIVKRSNSTLRQNLYTALIGPVHSGKSVAMKAAISTMGLAPPELENLMSGSAEGLLRKLSNADGCARLVSVDELGHLLSKAHIQNASFPFVLNRAFYDTAFDITADKGKVTKFHCEMSLIGGVPDDQFDKLFDAATVGGLYDRFIFGVCPQPFKFDYRPFEGSAEQINSVSVGVAPEVWEAKSIWLTEGVEPRCAENALRVAGICASVDGETLLRAKHLSPTFALAKYLTRVRSVLKPNPGENSDAKCAFAIIAMLEQLANNGSKGKWISRRQIYKGIHAERVGPSVFNRALISLTMNNDVDINNIDTKTHYRALEEK